jgi:hypothetical protein
LAARKKTEDANSDESAGRKNRWDAADLDSAIGAKLAEPDRDHLDDGASWMAIGMEPNPQGTYGDRKPEEHE